MALTLAISVAMLLGFTHATSAVEQRLSLRGGPWRDVDDGSAQSNEEPFSNFEQPEDDQHGGYDHYIEDFERHTQAQQKLTAVKKPDLAAVPPEAQASKAPAKSNLSDAANGGLKVDGSDARSRARPDNSTSIDTLLKNSAKVDALLKNSTSVDALLKLKHQDADKPVIAPKSKQHSNQSNQTAGKANETSETGEYACLIQAKNRSWAKGRSQSTYDLDKWQCMNIPEDSNDKISSYHVMSGSSCSVQFYGGSDCTNGDPLFETKPASLNKFRYTAGKDLHSTRFDNKISSVRCSCAPDVVYLYTGFVKVPGSDCEGRLPGTNFFSSEHVNTSSKAAAAACRGSCVKRGKRCLGFKMYRIGAAVDRYQCSFADAFWFKSHDALTSETFFVVDSLEEAAPACFIRTFSP